MFEVAEQHVKKQSVGIIRISQRKEKIGTGGIRFDLWDQPVQYNGNVE